MLKWLKRLLDDPTDPVKHCGLYRDKAAGSCAHVDGPLCDFPGCSMLADYRHIEAAASQAGISYAEALTRLHADGVREDGEVRPVAFVDKDGGEWAMTIERAAADLKYFYDKYGMPGADGVRVDDVLETGGGSDAQAAAAARGEHDDMIRAYDSKPENDALDSVKASLPPLPPYIYGREAGPNEKVWTEQAIREYGRACADGVSASDAWRCLEHGECFGGKCIHRTDGVEVCDTCRSPVSCKKPGPRPCDPYRGE